MISFFARHPTAANLLMVIMLAAGILSMSRLQRESLPDSRPVKVEVKVPFPGATATEVEESIVQRLEEALEGVRYLKETTSVATQSIGTITLEMLEQGEYTAFRNEIDNSVSGIDDFPDEAEPPVIMKLNTRQPVLDILVSGPMNAISLKAFAEQFRDRLVASPEISEVNIDGFSDHLLRVELSREAMLRFGLSPLQVSRAIAEQSLDLPAGKIETDETLLVRVQESRKSRLALEDLIISGSPGGAEIRLRDVARVIDEFELDEELVTVDGQRGVVLKVQKAKTEDIVNVAAAVKEVIAKQLVETPQLSITTLNDQSLLVVDRISLLLKNGVQGCILVFVIMWIFFNARLSFWVVFSLPVSFLAAFALVPGAGLTINMLTMVGLLMALGLLMDDGIVIAENIARRRSEGEPAMDAAVNGVAEVAAGVFSSFLTTCCVLGPLIFLTGEIGKILRVLPMMLLLVLAASLVEAFMILPAHLGHSLANEQKKNRFREWIELRIDNGRDLFAAIVGWTVRWRYLSLGLVVMAFLLTLSLLAGGFVRGKVFPDLEGDTLVARLLMPPGTPLKKTQEVVSRLESALQQTNQQFSDRQPDDQELVQKTFVRYNQNADAFESGSHVATIQADLLSNEQRDGRIVEIVDSWKRNLGDVPEAQLITIDEPSIGPTGRDIELQLSGVSLDELNAVSQKIQDNLATYVGVYNIIDDLRRGENEMLVTLRPGAVGMGVRTTDLANQLRGSFQGLLSDQIQVGDEAYDVEVRFKDSDRDSVADLEDYLFQLPNGQTVPLVEVAKITPRRGWSRINRFNGNRIVTVFGNVDSQKSNALAILADLRTNLVPQLVKEYPSLEVTFKGSSEKGAETGSSMGFAAVIGCLGVFVILSFQFRSYIEPIIVMVAIPFAFVGVVWGHWLMMTQLSLPSIMGYASLAGIVVNDSILLVLFLKQARADNMPVEKAAVEATRMRFRAVMITSLTTIAGLFPLLLERSLQAQILIPIAISISFGLLASTILVLLIIPAFYVILSDFGLTETTDEAHH
ncbi:MAG: efflux RND transporter permease subunit [Planctomycetota bacterium]